MEIPNILAQSFAKGAEEAGNEVEFVPMAGKQIGFCIGCWDCLKTKTCVVNHDDAEEVVQKIRRADVVVFATPIYYYEMSGQMKTLLDRTNCLYTADYDFRIPPHHGGVRRKGYTPACHRRCGRMAQGLQQGETPGRHLCRKNYD